MGDNEGTGGDRTEGNKIQNKGKMLYKSFQESEQLYEHKNQIGFYYFKLVSIIFPFFDTFPNHKGK